VAEFIYFAHGIVEDAGDDAAVAVAGWSGVALAQAEIADEGLALLVEDELQAHSVGIILATDEAVVLLHFHVAGVVALGLGGHAGILTCWVRSESRDQELLTAEVAEDCRGERGENRVPHAVVTFDRDPSTAVVLRIREAQPSLRMTGLLSSAGFLYTYRFWKSFLGAPCEIATCCVSCRPDDSSVKPDCQWARSGCG
jgi:hypothetical protein